MSCCSFTQFLFYGSISALYWYTWLVDTELYESGKFKKVGFPFDDSFGRRCKFLTYLTMGSLTFYFTYGALLTLAEFIGSKLGCCNKSTECKVTGECNSCIFNTFFNFLYTRVAFPFGTLVVFSFWTVYFADRELVYPLILDSIIPSWINHVMHTVPLLLIVENLFRRHWYPSFISGYGFSFLLGLLYIGWIHYIHNESGKWVYGILRTLQTPYRELYFVQVLAALALFYKLGQILNGRLWPQQPNIQGYRQHKKTN